MRLRVIVSGVQQPGDYFDKSPSSELSDWGLEDLPSSMGRLVLFEGLAVSIALHHVVADDFLVHNHRRPFYSYCVSGGYRHRIFSR